MKLSGIYKISSKIKPENFYIGSSMDIDHRLSCHFYDLKSNRHSNNRLQNHYNKYGDDDLSLNILMYCDIDNLIKNEQFYIDTLYPKFNLRKKAESHYLPSIKEETRNRLIYSHIGKKQSLETIEKRVSKLRGIKRSPEMARKVFNARKHFTYTLITRNKMRLSKLGTKQSDETKLKRSIKLTGRKASMQEIENKRKTSLCKPIIQYDLNHIFIREWTSTQCASRELNIVGTNISKVLRKQRLSAGGFTWEYINK